MASSYCEFVRTLDAVNVHKIYHDTEYGFPLKDDNALFGRLCLEINQAGLSWTTILNKKEHFHKAYDGFDIGKVAAYGEKQVGRLMHDAGIVRNRLKILAVIENAKRIQIIQKEFGSFRKWLDLHHPMRRDEWTALFKSTFKFTGGEIVNEFLVSSGFLPGAHVESCPVFDKVMKKKPVWALKKSS